MAGKGLNLTGRSPNKEITKSPLMVGNPKGGAKKKPVSSPKNYLDTSRAVPTDEEKEAHEQKVIDMPSKQQAKPVVSPAPVPTPERVSKTKDMLRKHMYYTKDQWQRTHEIAEELKQRKVQARATGTARQLSSEVITRNTFIRSSVDAVLSFFEIADADFVDNEEELTLLILDKMKKNVKQRSK